MKIGGKHRIFIRPLNRKPTQFTVDPAILQKIFLEAKKKGGKPIINIKKTSPKEFPCIGRLYLFKPK